MDDQSPLGAVHGFDRGMGWNPISAGRLDVFYGPARRHIPPSLPSSLFSAVDYFRSSIPIRLPRKVRFCVQRKQRREVLFAMKRAGFRGSAPKRHYRRTQNSQYRC